MKRVEQLLQAFKLIESKVTDIKFINLCTSDGFPICSHNFEDNENIGKNELSAATSSITALSVAASKQLIGADFKSTTIETENGNMLLIKTVYAQKDCILCFVSGTEHQIGTVRYFALKLSEYIISLAKVSAKNK